MKVRVDHLIIGVGSLVLLVGSLLVWRAVRPDPAEAELDSGLEQLRDKPGPKRGRALPRMFQGRRASSSGSELDDGRLGWSESELPPAGDPGELGPDAAVDEFKTVLAELEGAVGRKLSRHERAELYNRATGSFTALSAWVDGNDPSERALLDDAYKQMISLMKQLDIEPPRVNPDAPPVRR